MSEEKCGCAWCQVTPNIQEQRLMVREWLNHVLYEFFIHYFNDALKKVYCGSAAWEWTELYKAEVRDIVTQVVGIAFEKDEDADFTLESNLVQQIGRLCGGNLMVFYTLLSQFEGEVLQVQRALDKDHELPVPVILKGIFKAEDYVKSVLEDAPLPEEVVAVLREEVKNKAQKRMAAITHALHEVAERLSVDEGDLAIVKMPTVH